ncbi:hypothetical protein L2D00_00655 [Hyphomonadaceae bacterium BL14]|nr:hypothetical protein L2D00_00655 [Hyphomonadaceae bacterium BL14]
MIPVRASGEGRAAVMGLGLRGRAMARALAAGGMAASGWDEDADTRAAAARHGVVIEDPTTRDWGDLSALVIDDVSRLDGPESGPVGLARITGTPVLTELALFGRALTSTGGARAALVLGGDKADAAAELAGACLSRCGLDVRRGGAGVALFDAPPLRAGSITLIAASAAECAAAPDFHAHALLVMADAAISTADLEALAMRVSGPVLLDMDAPDAGARLAALRRGGVDRARVTACSGRMVLGDGFYLVGSRLHDARSGAPRRPLQTAGPGLAGLTPGLIAGAGGLALALGGEPDALEAAMAFFPGVQGWRNPVTGLGRVQVFDYAAAQDPKTALAGFTGAAPIWWIAHAGLDAAELPDTLPAALQGVILCGPDARAERRLASRMACRQADSLDDALARSLHAAALTGKDARILYAPSTRCGPEERRVRSQTFTAALERLTGLIRKGHAA